MEQIILFVFLVLFPFGQIIRVGIIQPIDVVAGIGAIYAIVKKLPKPEFFKYLKNFLFIATFSWIFSLVFFKQVTVLYGFLYLLRLVAYFYFFIYVWNFVKNKDKNRKLILNSLLSLSLISGLFGWIQFFVIPDLKPLFVLGWDMHLFRLAGTFLDPTFLGLIIVFGSIIALFKKKYLVLLFFIISLAFTYSRASYLAFVVGIGYLLYTKRKFGYILFPMLILVGLIFILPTQRNHSVEFFRSFSAFARIGDYKQTLEIFRSSPVFGVGYNNLCLAKTKFVGFVNFSSHACSGSDSSLLFILATTGILGLISFAHLMNKVWKSSDTIFKATSLALLIHSLFSNSMFYPWILGWMIVLLAKS